MEPLIINATTETPLITLDGSAGMFSIVGKSYPENVVEFYQPVFNYIDEYKLNTKPKTVLQFNLIYYNTATSKIIVKLIMKLKELATDFEIKWLCRKDDDLMIEKGEEIQELLNVNLQIVYI